MTTAEPQQPSFATAQPHLEIQSFIRTESVEAYWALTELFIAKASTNRALELEKQRELVLNKLNDKTSSFPSSLQPSEPSTNANLTPGRSTAASSPNSVDQAKLIADINEFRTRWQSEVLAAVTALEVVLQASSLKGSVERPNTYLANFEVSPIQLVVYSPKDG